MWDRQCDICCVDCHFYGNREILWFWRVPPHSPEGYYKAAQSIELQRLLQWPRPSQLPTLLARRIYCCPSTQIKSGGKKKTLSGKSMCQPNVHSQWPFDQFVSKIQLNCHRGEKRKPHVQSVWSPRSPGTSIASLFSSALLRYQIVKKAESMTLYPLTLGLLGRCKKK